MAPPAKKAVPATAAKQLQKGKDSPIGPKKRKLACIPCRERRVRCDWPEGGGGCAACALARLRCPGEPAPKKRLKKGEQPPRGGPSEVDLRMKKYQFGSAVTFHLIETHLQVANPSIPGMPYDFFRDFLKKAGGKSREMEIAAEVFCGAFVATSAAFTDHVVIIGTTDLDQPYDSPLGLRVDYTPFHPIGQKRRDALEALSLNARQIFEDSGMRLRPSVEAIYALWTMDEMVLLTGERGRGDREYVGLMCQHWRTMLGQRKKELTEEQVEQLQGPVGVALLLLDAETAATLRQPCSITDSDLSSLVPHLSAIGAATPVFDPVALANEETGWESLGQQLVPLSLSMTALYRAFSRTELSAFHIVPTTLTPFYTALDSAYSTLSTAAHVIASLPPLPDALDTAWRAFDLFSLINHFRRSVLRLDLLAHQRVIEALLQSQKPPEPKEKPNNRGAAKGKSAIRDPTPPPAPPTVREPAGPPSPPPALLQAYSVSRQRVHRAFALAAEMAKHAVETSSLSNARRLTETLEVCSSWTSMRNADQGMAAELCGELGIGMEMGQIFLQLLSLCSWSSHSALFLHQGLLGGLTLLNNHIPPPPCPYPPASGLIHLEGGAPPVRINHSATGGGYRPGAFATGSPHSEGTGRKARRKEAKKAAEELEERERLRAMGMSRISSAASSVRGSPSASASTVSFMSKKDAEDFVPDWSFLDEYMSPEEKAKQAAAAASSSAGSSSSPAPLAPTVSTSTGTSSSSSRSISSAMRQAVRNVAAAASKRSPSSTNQVQSRLEAAAAPLFFKPSFKLKNPPSIQAVVGRATGRSQPAPPTPQPQPQQSMMRQVQPAMQTHYPSPSTRPSAPPGSSIPTYPVSFPTPPGQHAHTAYPSAAPPSAAYPYMPPPQHQQQSLPLPSQGFAPTPLPPPPSYTPSVPSSYPHQQPQSPMDIAPHQSISPSIPHTGYPSAAYVQQSLPQARSPPPPPPAQPYASYTSPASSSLPHHHHHTHPQLLPQPPFPGTPSTAAPLPSYPVPLSAPLVDSSSATINEALDLALEPLDPQTLALLASLPVEGAGDVNMGAVSPVLGSGGAGGGTPEPWGMQGVETYLPHQQTPTQHQAHLHQPPPPPPSGGGWM